MSRPALSSRKLAKSRSATSQSAALLIGISILLFTLPASAHHASGGSTPSSWLAGLLSGFAHPLIGMDHFAFVVATGLLALTLRRGILLPLTFCSAVLIGTGAHLMSASLPAPELIISTSVVLFGLMLAISQRLTQINSLVIIALGAIAGIFHGYAYGEAIIGAEMSPLIAYLAGFTLIQLAIAFTAYGIGRIAIQPSSLNPSSLRGAGLVICGAGLAFVSSVLLG